MKINFDPYEDYKKYAEAQRRYAINQMFIKGNRCDDLDDYQYLHQKFIWLKTLICLKLKWYGFKGFGTMVIAFDEYSYPDGMSWSYVSVGKGIFKNWGIEIGTDGI
jgi:hypothetical protein